MPPPPTDGNKRHCVHLHIDSNHLLKRRQYKGAENPGQITLKRMDVRPVLRRLNRRVRELPLPKVWRGIGSHVSVITANRPIFVSICGR